jgi:hypothetical protein
VWVCVWVCVCVCVWTGRQVTMLLQGTRCKSQNDDMVDVVVCAHLRHAAHAPHLPAQPHCFQPDVRTQERCWNCVMSSSVSGPEYAERLGRGAIVVSWAQLRNGARLVMDGCLPGHPGEARKGRGQR